MLQNIRVTAFTVSELLSEHQQEVKLLTSPPPPPPLPRLELITRVGKSPRTEADKSLQYLK